MVNPPVGEPSKIDRPSAPVSLTATSLTSLMFSLIGGATPVGQAHVTFCQSDSIEVLARVFPVTDAEPLE
jgi:hypothetical protein